MDCIKIRRLEVFAYHGCEEEEKINGQIFYVDADLYSDIRTPGISDNLNETVDYSKVCDYIHRFMKENRFDLIEAAAEQVTRGLLKEFPKIREIELTIHKPSAPISLPFDDVSVTVRRKWNKSFLSIGSNIGDKQTYLNQAVDSIYDDDNCRVNMVSKFIETEPYGPIEQDNFLNGCIEIETLYSPKELLEAVNNIEAEAGRTRELHWGPRTLDIDIALYGDEIIDEPNLKIPHVEMHKRLFVLEPLNQIAPYAIHPIYRKTVCQMLEELKVESKSESGSRQCPSVEKQCEGCSGCRNI